VRDSKFKVLADTDVSFFESILESNCVIKGEEEIGSSNYDWTKKFKG
jgi:hypothetical protein